MVMGLVKVYLLNSLIVPIPPKKLCTATVARGVSLSAVKSLLDEAEEVISAIGHEATARVMSELLGIEVKVNRVEVVLNEGDHAIVFRVATRLPEGKVLSREELEKLPVEWSVVTIEECHNLPPPLGE